MPELPEVMNMCRVIKKHLSPGICTLKNIMINQKSWYYSNCPNNLKQMYPNWPYPLVNNDIINLFINEQINNIYVRGKKLLIQLNTCVFVFTFALEGRFLFQQDNYSGICLNIERQNVGDSVNIFYSDSRKLGKMYIAFNQQQLNDILKDVGPDYMNSNIQLDTFISVIRKHGGMRICEFLMEQKYFSGIGNYLRAEILYETRLNPITLCSYISNQKLVELYNNIYTIIYNSYKSNGLTIATYRDPDGNKGVYIAKAYQRKIDDYGNRVETFQDKNSRTVHWVPNVQNTY